MSYTNLSDTLDETQADAAPRARPLILVVDDDVTIRAMAEHHFGEAGFDVITLGDGTTIIETYQTHRPDAVLLDVMLPDRDGYSICRELRALPGTMHLPIAMLTSLDDESAIREAFDAGATEFLPKPLNWLHETYRLRYLLRASATVQDLDAARETIAQAKQEWEQTFFAIEDPVILLNPDLVVLKANAAAARLGHLPLENLVGRQFQEVFLYGESDTKNLRAEELLAPSKDVNHAELHEFGPGKRNCLVSASPVFSGTDHRPVATVVSLKDVTEYRELEREFLHAQKMEALGVLAAGIAHDFNNLLQGIVGFSELLSTESQTQEEMQEGLSQIKAFAAKGRALTRQLLLSSRKGTRSHGPMEIAPLIHETVELLERTVPKTITLETSIAEDLWSVEGEASHLQQALVNLSINGSHAMPDGGTLCLLATNATLDQAYAGAHPECKTGPHVLVAVSDTGCGIDAATREKMYEPFFTTKGPHEGTGLGLSVVYGIVREHGGHLCCYSEAGEGTTFKFYIPALPQEASRDAATPAQKDLAPVSGEGKTVLLVEDEQLIQRVVEKFLCRAGYQVIKAGDGQEALERYQADGQAIDVIVMDMNMPRMDGEHCLEELVKLGCPVPVIMATGALFSAERQKKLLQHATAIVMKPFEFKALLSTIAEAAAPATV